MELKCYHCEATINEKDYLEVVFKGEIIGYICKRCKEN
jgi:hypothetical protein